MKHGRFFGEQSNFAKINTFLFRLSMKKYNVKMFSDIDIVENGM